MPRTLIALAAAVALLAIALPSTAAASPTNDLFGNATVIGASASSFTDYADVGSASIEAVEPQYCNYASKTVWYSITPNVNETIKVNLGGSGFYDTELNVYRQDGTDISGLSFLNCGSYAGSGISFDAHAGTTYYIQAGTINGSFGTLQLNFQAIRPPGERQLRERDADHIGAVLGLVRHDIGDRRVGRADAELLRASDGHGLVSVHSVLDGVVFFLREPLQRGGRKYRDGAGEPDSDRLCSVQLVDVPRRCGEDAYYLQVGGIYGVRGAATLTADVARTTRLTSGSRPSRGASATGARRRAVAHGIPSLQTVITPRRSPSQHRMGARRRRR